MSFGRGGFPWVVCGVLVGAPVLARADPQHFDIPAQPLPAALRAFASQAHVQLLYVYNVVVNGHGNAVRGELDVRRALDELLRGTGFEAAYTSDTEIMIRRTAAPAVSDPGPGRRDSGRSRTPPYDLGTVAIGSTNRRGGS